MASWWTSWLTAPWQTAGRRRTIGSVAISTLLHGSLLAACALWMLRPQADRQTLPIRTTWDESPAPQLTPVELLPVATEPDSNEAGGMSDGHALFHQADANVGEAMAIDVASLASLDQDGRFTPTPFDTQMVGLSGGQGLGAEIGTGRGQGSGAGEGDGAGSGFFGLSAEGRRVVYVVDASRSMNHPYPGPTKTRFGRVKLELVNAISAMTDEQEFFIVYFNDQAWPMPATTMKLAVPSVRYKYLQWAVAAKTGGGTDPEAALFIALSLKPDVIYFLTDGDFNRQVVEHVRVSNQQLRIAIHTIGFGDEIGKPLLEAIAEQNGGTYQFIPGE